MEERLQKVLAKAGVASRRHSEELILSGKVKVNGKFVTELGTKVNPLKDKISVNGKPLPAAEKKVYYILNKPRGYVTTVSDERGRKTIMDILEGVEQRVYPVGRLDYDSEGLLLLTNDGELTQALTHPSHKVKKTYQVTVKGIPEMEQLKLMAKGLELEDGMTAPAEVRLVSIGEDRASLEISIHEGRNRQVRRMCEHIGHEVLRLRRIRIGSLSLEKLKSGEFRPLTLKEIREIRTLVGLKTDINDLQMPTKIQTARSRNQKKPANLAGKAPHKNKSLTGSKDTTRNGPQKSPKARVAKPKAGTARRSR